MTILDETDYQMEKDEAQHTQNIAIEADELLIWSVTWGTADFGETFVARPQLGRSGRFMHRHLRADTLDDLRKQLPVGLSRIERSSGDDSVIVEVWL